MATGNVPKWMDGTEEADYSNVEPSSSVSLASHGAFRVRRTGPIVEIYGYHIKNNNAINSGSSVVLGTLDTKYRPRFYRAIFSAGSAGNPMGQIVIGHDSKNVTFYNCGSTTWAAGTNINLYAIYIAE